MRLIHENDKFGIYPFTTPVLINNNLRNIDFKFDSETTAKNSLKLLRGMTLNKPILLEGPPGIGKSSIVESMAQVTGNKLVRINFSDQTEISDLFGSDLPIDDNDTKSLFAWRDGPLLSALKKGCWILLDELNLASQSVLEGLNACLDHRGEIYVPELNKTFKVQPGSNRIFACQNPYNDGGDRKGLPKSFLNRFIRINFDALTERDITEICFLKFGKFDDVDKIVKFVRELSIKAAKFIGGPWNINLRDISRFCRNKNPDLRDRVIQLLFVDRFRSSDDRETAIRLYEEVFRTEFKAPTPFIHVNNSELRVGSCRINRLSTKNQNQSFIDNQVILLSSQYSLIENLMLCLHHKWIPILVGDAEVGKSKSIEILSSLCNQPLIVIPLCVGSDTNDLLGGFDQTDISHELQKLIRKINNLSEFNLNILQDTKQTTIMEI